MPLRDVCPITRLRCATPNTCAERSCGVHVKMVPISESSLSAQERYAMLLAEQQAIKGAGEC